MFKKRMAILFLLLFFVVILVLLYSNVIHRTTTIANMQETECNLISNANSNIEENISNIIVVSIDEEDNEENNILQELFNKTSYLEIGELELPVSGATGYASINLDLKSSNSLEANNLNQLKAGSGFQILQEQNGWWQVQNSFLTGWVENKYCMINLPDVIPSIIYDNTNSYSSLFKSSGYNLSNITGKSLYDTKKMNPRLEKQEFMMPVMYGMAKKICVAQQLALKEGNSLKIYETFRPYSTQKAVSKALKELVDTNEVVNAGINNGNWNESWFIAQGISNHQRAIAIDVSLVKVKNTTTKSVGNYIYTSITEYEEYDMPTKMHELSSAAVTFKYGVSSQLQDAWKGVPLAESMNENAIKLQNYCTSANLSPLASEWWHFDDLQTKENLKEHLSTGQYFITECYSSAPVPNL